MPKILAQRRGTTTVEVLGAAACGAIVLTTLYSFYREQLIHLVVQETRTATLEDARGALDIMARELRNAGYWGSGTAPAGCQRIVTATATSIRIQADINGDGDCDGATSTEVGEDVTYDLSGATPTCPGAILRRNGNCLVANIAAPPGQSLFTYFDEADLRIAGVPQPDLIKRIKITLSVEVADPSPPGKAAGRKIASTLSSSVELRNPQRGLP